MRSRTELLIVIPELKRPRISCNRPKNGGFVDFQARYPELCEGGGGVEESLAPEGGPPAPVMYRGLSANRPALTSLSQPCLPASAEGPTKILPFLYLGSQQDSLDVDTLKKYGIDYVINLSLNCPRPAHLCKDEHFMRIPVNDSYQEKLLPYFDKAFDFLDKVRESGSAVLIHCLAGISRSPTVAIAYIMKQCNMTTDEAYTYVKTKRPSISPNFNFMGQLLEYEEMLKKCRSKDVAAMLQHKTSSPSRVPQTACPDASSDSEMVCRQPSLLPTDSTVSDSESSSVSQDSMRRCLSCPVKMHKSASCVQLRSQWVDLDEQSPSSQTNENGKRQMRPARSVHSEDSTYSSGSSTLEQDMEQTEWAQTEVERPRGLTGLKARRMLNIPQPVKEDLPSPSTELSKLSFSTSFCRPVDPLTRPLSSCCPGSSATLAHSPPVQPVFPSDSESNDPVHIVDKSRNSVFATNPFFVAFSAVNHSTGDGRRSTDEIPEKNRIMREDASDGVVVEQPRSCDRSRMSAENPLFGPSSFHPVRPEPSSRFGLSRLAHFLRRGAWSATGGPSLPLAVSTKSRCRPDLPNSTTMAVLSGAEPLPSSSATSTDEKGGSGPAKSQSESGLLYALCDELDSPESGFVESPVRDSLEASARQFDPERESIGSTSSLEIAVN